MVGKDYIGTWSTAEPKEKGIAVYTAKSRSILDENQIAMFQKDLLSPPEGTIVSLVDFSNVEHLSSAGLGSLRHAREFNEGNRRKFALVGLNSQLHEIFNITRLCNEFTFYSSLNEVREAYGFN